MSRFLVAALAAFLFVSVGCQDKDKNDSSDSKAMKASADACSHCPGVQKATADGKCPDCGMKVSAAKAAGGDVCSACAGVQTATADNKCSGCGASLAKK